MSHVLVLTAVEQEMKSRGGARTEIDNVLVGDRFLTKETLNTIEENRSSRLEGKTEQYQRLYVR